MGAHDLPVTESAFGPPGQHRDSPLEQEWSASAHTDQDVIFYWAGVWNREGTQIRWTWGWHHLSQTPDHGGHPHPAAATPAANVERMLSPLAHEARISIMQAMYDGPKASGELSEATGLRGGNLYYHLKELLHADYVRELNGGYDLTPLGCQLLLTVAAIASKVVSDRGEAGLLVQDTVREATREDGA